jgi:hypothetical protein
MKKTSIPKPRKTAEAAKEYRFDYSKAKPNRFAAGVKDAPLVAVIDPDLAKIFTTAEQVNTALRALISAMPDQKTKITRVPSEHKRLMEIRRKLGKGKQNKKSSVEILSEMRR